jgi:hypothetical protein
MHTLYLFVFVSSVLAAPVPADTEKPKPRPKLVGTVSLPVNAQHVIWLPDGKHVLLQCGDDVARVIRRDQFGDDEPTGKPVAEFKLPTESSRLDLSPDGAELYTVTSAGKKMTAESRAHFWSLKRVLEGKDGIKPDRVVSLEADAVGLGTLVADGRHLIAPVIEPKKTQPDPNAQPAGLGGGWGGSQQQQEYTVRFERVSAKTGDLAGDGLKLDEADFSYASHAVDAKTNRLFLQLHASDETVIRCVDLTTGKKAWERKLEGQPQKGRALPPVSSPNGGFLGVMQMQLVGRPAGGQFGGPAGGFGGPPAGGRGGGARGGQMSYSARSMPVLLNAKTGEPVNLSADDLSGGQFFDFSADGRLLLGLISKDTGVNQVVVWDTKTGKVVKVWSGTWQTDKSFAFAPTGYELLVVEREQKSIYGPSSAVPQGFNSNGGQQWTTTREMIRTDYKSVLGVWDLPSVVK